MKPDFIQSTSSLYLLSTNQENKTHSNTLLVSLYLVLLAFFILLNAIATHDLEKEKEAFESVKSSFSQVTVYSKPREGAILPKSSGNQLAIHEYMQNMGTLASSIAQLVELEVQNRGDVMIWTVPVEQFFAPDSYQIQEALIPLIGKLAHIAFQEIAGAFVESSFVITTRYLDVMDNKGIKSAELPVFRVSEIAKQITRRRVDAERIRVGIKEGKEAILTMEFYIKLSDN